MKRTILLLLLSLFFSAGYADSPPSWERFKITSKNQLFFAWIDNTPENPAGQPWGEDWIVQVYSKDSTLLWSAPYIGGGYSEGSLSDDGATYVYVEQWYSREGHLIAIMSKNKPGIFIKATEFYIPDIFLIHTSSHQLWLSSYILSNDALLVTTRDGRKWRINTSNGTTHLIGFEFTFLNTVLSLGIMITVMAVIFIIKRIRK